MSNYIDFIKALSRDAYIFLNGVLIFIAFDSYCTAFLDHNAFFLINNNLLQLNIKLLPIITPFFLIFGIIYYFVLARLDNLISRPLNGLVKLSIILYLKFLIALQTSLYLSKKRQKNFISEKYSTAREIRKVRNFVNSYNQCGNLFCANKKLVTLVSQQVEKFEKNNMLESLKKAQDHDKLYLFLIIILFIYFFQNNSLSDFFGSQLTVTIGAFVFLRLCLYYTCSSLLTKGAISFLEKLKS